MSFNLGGTCARACAVEGRARHLTRRGLDRLEAHREREREKGTEWWLEWMVLPITTARERGEEWERWHKGPHVNQQCRHRYVAKGTTHRAAAEFTAALTVLYADTEYRSQAELCPQRRTKAARTHPKCRSSSSSSSSHTAYAPSNILRMIDIMATFIGLPFHLTRKMVQVRKHNDVSHPL